MFHTLLVVFWAVIFIYISRHGFMKIPLIIGGIVGAIFLAVNVIGGAGVFTAFGKAIENFLMWYDIAAAVLIFTGKATIPTAPEENEDEDEYEATDQEEEEGDEYDEEYEEYSDEDLEEDEEDAEDSYDDSKPVEIVDAEIVGIDDDDVAAVFDAEIVDVEKHR